MKASEFMTKIDRGEIEFKTNFASGTFGWGFDFAEAYASIKCKELEEQLEKEKLNEGYFKDMNNLIDQNNKLKEQLEKAKDKYCRCPEEETTGSTTFECCNICGKILTSKT